MEDSTLVCDDPVPQLKRGRSDESDGNGQLPKRPTIANMAAKNNQPQRNLITEPFLSNRFGVLAGKSKNDVPASVNVVKKDIVPPIIVKNLQFSQIQEIINNLNIKKYTFKIMSIGIKIQVNTLSDHDVLNKKLIEDKSKFFTYDTVKNTNTKFVLSGLPCLSTDEVIDAFKEQGLEVIEVKAMNLKSPKSTNHALFIVLVEKSKISDLLKIKYLLHTVVRIRRYIQTHRGPIQCSNCHLHGHGEKNCHLQPRCPNCGEEHNITDCKSETIKCCNCNGNHQATNKDCSARINFIAMKQNLSRKPKTRQIQQKRPVFNYEKDFPSFSKSTTFNPVYNWGSTKHHQQPQTVDDDLDSLFNLEEIMTITRDVLTSLKSCKNKIDQFETITRLAAKYIYGAR